MIVATRGGTAIRLGQVARVVDTQEEARDAAYINGQRAVSLEIRKTAGANTVDVVDGVRHAIEVLNASLPGGVRLTTVQEDAGADEVGSVGTAAERGGAVGGVHQRRPPGERG